MIKRFVKVRCIEVNSTAFSSILHIGDAVIATPSSRILAVQQYNTTYSPKTEEYFRDYPIFSQQPIWVHQNKKIEKHTFVHDKMIRVNNVFINGISQSAICQIGSLKKVKADARVKHIRKSRDIGMNSQ